jgi:hypothetical protein
MDGEAWIDFKRIIFLEVKRYQFHNQKKQWDKFELKSWRKSIEQFSKGTGRTDAGWTHKIEKFLCLKNCLNEQTQSIDWIR